MLETNQQVPRIPAAGFAGLPDEVLASTTPVVLEDLAADWPLVKAGKRSADEAIAYMRGFYRDATVGVFIGDPAEDGRVFYNDDMGGFNYQRALVKLDTVFDRLLQHAADERPPAIYVGSTTIDACLPGLRAANDVRVGDYEPLASIWLGNRTRVAAHYDLPDNAACNAVGHRRFTLFPPDQLENLYVGPLDFTPAGQSISLVDFANPDFRRFPRFRDALKHAQVAELAPGDAIFIPSMWWHHVEALDSLNVLVNYWWRRSPAFMGAPVDVLMHAILNIRELPDEQRRAWRRIFEYYVFDFDEAAFAHIPGEKRGVLGPMDERMARELRTHLLNKLNR